MNNWAKFVSLIMLGLVIVPCFINFFGALDLNAVKLIALIGTIGWFLFTPMWMGREVSPQS
jgi:hypothetical protein